MPDLFSTFTLRGLTLRNRIMMSPMCMYMAEGAGLATDWHLVHLGSRAIGGTGLIMTETVAIEPRGRIHEQELGLWSDAHVPPLARIVAFCHAQGAAVGVQLAHAGRKAYTSRKGNGPLRPIAPSALPHGEEWATPEAMTLEDIEIMIARYRDAVQRAAVADFDVVEIHAAHGYLLHQFFSPLANRRTDTYGGSPKNRMRFLCEVVAAAREVWPEDKPLFVRISATDWLDENGGLTPKDWIPVIRALAERGADLIDCSSGGITPQRPPDLGPGYQVPFAEMLRRGTGVPTAAVGLITSAELADAIIRNGRADIVALGRAMLRSPYWPLEAARRLGYDVPWPPQYARAKLSPVRRAPNIPFVLET